MPEDKDKIGVKVSPRKRILWLFLAIILLLLMVAAAALWRYMQKPATGRILNSSQPADEKKVEKIKKRFESKYLSFSHYDSYKLKTHEEEKDEKDRILERAFFSEESTVSKKIALTVSKLSGANLSNNADYKMRLTYPDKYKKEKFESGDLKADVFSVRESAYFEKVYFIIHGEYLAEIAFSINSVPEKNLEEEADAIAASVIWK